MDADARDVVFAELFAKAEARASTGACSPFTAASLWAGGVCLAEEVCDGPQGFAAHRLLERVPVEPEGAATLFTTLAVGPGVHEQRLRARGWTVESALPWPAGPGEVDPRWGERARALVLGWARGQVAQRPEVTCKVACTLDGHIATAGGESQWITEEPARMDGHFLRATHDAILVGIETALADDPALTCRSPEHADAHPTPVVLDTRLRLPHDATLLHGERRALVFVGPDAPERAINADVIRVALDDAGHVHMHEVLKELSVRGLHRILIEGGGQIHRAVLDAGLVDWVVLYQAPTLLPGGRPWVAGTPVSSLEGALGLDLHEVVRLGRDLRLTLKARHRCSDPWTDAGERTR